MVQADTASGKGVDGKNQGGLVTDHNENISNMIDHEEYYVKLIEYKEKNTLISDHK